MPVIRVSDTTWERLKAHAEPLVDSVDDVVRRALDALESTSDLKTKAKDAPSITLSENSNALSTKKQNTTDLPMLPQNEFRVPLLKVMNILGGSGTTREIRCEMETEMSSKLQEGDFRKVSSGEVRWWNAVCWVRNDFVKEGIFKRGSPRGVWELSN